MTLHLPQVTLCAVTSVNLAATLRALESSMSQIRFGACKLLTDHKIIHVNPQLQIVPIAPLRSAADYSAIMLNELRNHIDTPHCLIVQWDGHVLEAKRWRPEFLDYDYIGASWPQFDDGYDVGNGGFSLRSQRLLNACVEPDFRGGHPEDVVISRTNRRWLEDQGMRFADSNLADVFSTERAGDLGQSFGYHGVFNMPRALGTNSFWEIYRQLDDVATLKHDFSAILGEVVRGKAGVYRATRMIFDKLRFSLRSLASPVKHDRSLSR